MQGGNVIRVRTISTVQFTAACAHGGAALVENIDPAKDLAAGGAGAGLSAGKHCRSRLHELRILSVQNLAWAIELYGSATGIAGSDIDAEKFLGRFEFAAADGKKDTADTFYKYWVPGLDLSYEDLDKSGKVHLRLVNIDAATDKIADALGAVVVELGLEPTQGI